MLFLIFIDCRNRKGAVYERLLFSFVIIHNTRYCRSFLTDIFFVTTSCMHILSCLFGTDSFSTCKNRKTTCACPKSVIYLFQNPYSHIRLCKHLLYLFILNTFLKGDISMNQNRMVFCNSSGQSLHDAHGKIPFNMTNDYMFRAVLQSNNKVLRGLTAAM